MPERHHQVTCVPVTRSWNEFARTGQLPSQGAEIGMSIYPARLLVGLCTGATCCGGSERGGRGGGSEDTSSGISASTCTSFCHDRNEALGANFSDKSIVNCVEQQRAPPAVGQRTPHAVLLPPCVEVNVRTACAAHLPILLRALHKRDSCEHRSLNACVNW